MYKLFFMKKLKCFICLNKEFKKKLAFIFIGEIKFLKCKCGTLFINKKLQSICKKN